MIKKTVVLTGSVRTLQNSLCTCSVKEKIIANGFCSYENAKDELFSPCVMGHLSAGAMVMQHATFFGWPDAHTSLEAYGINMNIPHQTPEEIARYIRQYFFGGMASTQEGLYVWGNHFSEYWGERHPSDIVVSNVARSVSLSGVANGAICLNVVFRQETIENRTFKNIVFSSCMLPTLTLKKCKFVDCIFVGTRANHATLEDITFSGGVLGLDVEYSTLKRVKGVVERLHMIGDNSVLQTVKLAGENMSGCTLYSCQIRRVVIKNAILTDCSEKPPVLRECCACHQKATKFVRLNHRAFVCQSCAQKKEYYSARNQTYKGTPDASLMFSVEFEVHDRTGQGETQDALVLLSHGFLKCSDGSVDEEYKSPIYRSLVAALPALKAMDSISNLVDNHCGTHIHVDCKLVHSISPEVFRPLLDYMLGREQETRHFWGRFFNPSYARAHLGGDRFNAFSVGTSSQTTIEYRLPRFRNTKQYLCCLKFCRAATKLIQERYLYTPDDLLDAESIGQEVLAMYKESVKCVE